MDELYEKYSDMYNKGETRLSFEDWIVYQTDKNSKPVYNEQDDIQKKENCLTQKEITDYIFNI